MGIEEHYNDNEHTFVHDEYMYVNSGGVMAGDNDFILELQTNLPHGVARNQYLMMTPRMAKQFREMLNDAIEHYEETVDEIYLGDKVSSADKTDETDDGN